MGIVLFSYGNIGADTYSGRKPSGLEFMDDIVLVNEDPSKM